jgi:hypothetical protein
MFSNIHTMPLLMAFLAKPMFRVIEPLFISEQTMVVMWQIFQGLSKNIFPCHLIISSWPKVNIKATFEVNATLGLFHNC